MRTLDHPQRRYRVGFVVEQALGHRTHGENLRLAVPRDPQIDALFGFVPYEVEGWAARVPIYRSNWTVRAGLRARRLIGGMSRQGPLEALFVHTQVPAVLASDWLRRVPSVVSLDATPLQYDSLGESYSHARGPAWLERLKWRLNRRAFGSARRLVAWSAWAREGLREGYGVEPGRVSVIPPGVHTRDWARAEPRRPHGAPLRVLFVGGDLERKGGTLLLAAVRALRATTPIELDLVTRSPVAPEPGLRVHHGMQGNSPELRALYHAADVFCLPTLGDCLPMVLAEAAASGLPSIATDVAAIPEIVQDGVTGLLIRPRDEAGLGAALRRLAVDQALRLDMGERAVALATREHDAGDNAGKILEILKSVALRRPAAGGTQPG